VKLIVDILMFVDFLVLAVTGFVLRFILPRGSGKFGGRFIFLREDWHFIHDWTSVILICLLILHLLLNWQWIKFMILGLFKKK
jgi:cytochrome b subunit of formate dehydrogenase